MKNIDFASAENLILNLLKELSIEGGFNLRLVDGSTKRVEDGWVFFYNSVAYLDNADLSMALAGNGPFFVNNYGDVFQLPTHLSWDVALKDSIYEKLSIDKS